MRRLLATTCLLLLTAAAAVPAATAREQSGGWTSHRTASGMRIAAPVSWIDVTRLTPQVLEKARQLPALRSIAEAARQSHAVKLLLADAGADALANGFSTNLNVTQVPALGDLRAQRDASLAQLRTLGIVRGALHARSVVEPAGPAVELRYHARYGTVTPLLAHLQFLFVRGGSATVVTYTTLASLETAQLPLFRRSIATFRLR